MPEDKPYQPLSERLNQDVMHDNFVPKFSGLATAKPSALILVGVWLIFVPWLGFALLILAGLSADSVGEVLIEAIFAALSAVLCGTILFVQTRRFLRYHEPSEKLDEEENDQLDRDEI